MNALLAPFTFAILLAQSALLALGQIRANKMRSFLTTIGIIIGVASVTAVIAGLTGLKTRILADFETLGTTKVMIWPQRPDTGPMKQAPWETIRFTPEQVEGLLANCPSVEAYSKICGMGGVVRRGQKTLDGVEVCGVDPNAFKVENRSIIVGRPFTLLDDGQRRHVCVITPAAGDRLLLDHDPTGQSLQIDGKTFMIVGVVEAPQRLAFGGQTGEDLGVYVPFGTAYSRRTWMSVDAIAKSPEVAEEAQAEITFFLRRTRNIKPGDPNTFGIETMRHVLDQFNSIATGVTAVASGIVAISLLVGGIGITNIMLVSVSERTREIGLRKSIGARPTAILLQFLVEAITLCLVGGLLGLAGGWLLTKAIAGIPNAEMGSAYIPFWAVELSFGFCTAVGLIFGMVPAIKAARLDPIEALRHE